MDEWMGVVSVSPKKKKQNSDWIMRALTSGVDESICVLIDYAGSGFVMKVSAPWLAVLAPTTPNTPHGMLSAASPLIRRISAGVAVWS